MDLVLVSCELIMYVHFIKSIYDIAYFSPKTIHYFVKKLYTKCIVLYHIPPYLSACYTVNFDHCLTVFLFFDLDIGSSFFLLLWLVFSFPHDVSKIWHLLFYYFLHWPIFCSNLLTYLFLKISSFKTVSLSMNALYLWSINTTFFICVCSVALILNFRCWMIHGFHSLCGLKILRLETAKSLLIRNFCIDVKMSVLRFHFALC